MYFKKKVIMTCSLLIFVSCTTLPIYNQENIPGVIFDSQQVSEMKWDSEGNRTLVNFLIPEGPFWTPTFDEIVLFERAFLNHVKDIDDRKRRRTFKKYYKNSYRQYIGIIRNDKKVVYAQILDKYDSKSDSRLHHWIGTMYDIIKVQYDVNTDTLLDVTKMAPHFN